jgi:RNA polymerase sigma factor (sigma-70 family)
MSITQTRIALSQLRRTLRRSMDEPADRDLLARFAGGDEHAFATLVRRHGPMVLGVCRGVLNNPADAEDAFQATFLALARWAGRAGWRSSLAGWLHEVARRTAVKLRARAACRLAHERKAAERGRDETGWSDLREVLDEEVHRLPAAHREAILRCYFDGQMREQAARQLGWSLRTLERRLEQARQLLRERLTARGTTLAVLLALSPAVVPEALADLTVRAALGEAPVGVAELARTALSGLATLRGKLVLAGLLLAGLAVGTALALLPRTTPPVHTAAPPAQHNAAPAPIEQPLPEGALARLGSTRFRHGFLVSAVAYSRDGKVLASAGNGRGLCLWDASTGRFLHHCNTQRMPAVYSLALSPDGRTVADAEGAIVKLWSVATGKELRACSGHTNGVMALAFSPRGDVLASGGHDNTVRLWDAGSGRQLHVLKGHNNGVRALAFRDDDKVLASVSSDGTIRLWDPRAGKELHVGKGHKEVVALAFEPAGKRFVSSGSGGSVPLWDSDTGKPIRILASEEPGAYALAFAPDGRTVAVGRNGMIRLHDVATGKELRRWQAHVARINALAWSPDGKTLASGAIWDSSVRRWDPKTGKERTAGHGHVAPVDQLRFRKDGRLFSIGRDGRMLEWDLATGKARSLAPDWPIRSLLRVLAISSDGNTLAWASGATTKPDIHLYEAATGKELHTLSGHKGAVMALAFRSDGQRLVSLAEDRTLRAWQVDTGAELWQAPAGDARAGRVSFTQPLAFSPDGKLVACAMDSTLQVLDAATGKEVRKYSYGQAVFALAWSPDSATVAMVGGYSAPTVGLYDVRSGALEHSWQSPQAGVYGVAFSADGRLLATGGDERDSSVCVWELATGGKVAAFAGHHSAVLPVAFSPDNRVLASGGGDSSVLLWDVTGRTQAGRLRPAAVSAARFAQLWEKLGAGDAAEAQAAVWELVAGGRAVVPLLKARLPVLAALDAGKAARLVERLDSDEFATRESAMKEAAKLGLGAEPALRKALGTSPGLEPRRRVDALVAGWVRSPNWLRFRRAVAVLEHGGSAEAR